MGLPAGRFALGRKTFGGSFVTVQFDFSMLCDNNTAAAAID